MNKPFSKKDLKAKIKTWAEYQDDYLDRKQPLLHPVTIEMVSKRGKLLEFEMNRMDTKQLRGLSNKILSNVPANNKGAIKKVIDHYIDYFQDKDESESAVPASPLDFKSVNRSAIYLIYLNNKNVTFSGFKQFVCTNDDPGNPFTRQLAVFDAQRGILVNRSGKAPKGLKYDYYVTIHQDGGKATDIIIDPRDDDGIVY